MQETFTIKGDYIELIKLLKATGITDTGGMAKMAIEDGFDYILQIDSDGQCDPQYLASFWTLRDYAPIFGYRTSRDDGKQRWWISRVVSLPPAGNPSAIISAE